jgi:putative transposase
MVAFIDELREEYGVEPICKVLPIAPSTYDHPKAREADPPLRPARVQRDEQLREEVRRVWKDKRSTACARSGASSTARGIRWPVVRWLV